MQEATQQIPALETTKNIVVLSDFDYTLCHDYVDDGDNNLVPIISDSVVNAGAATDMYIATGRRAKSVAIDTMWDSGIYPIDRPIITENGGVLVYRRPSGNKYLELIQPYQVRKLPGIKSLIEAALEEYIDPTESLVIKRGMTMITARIKTALDSHSDPESHQLFVDKVRDLMSSQHEFGVVDNRTSLTVQHRTVNKANGFRKLLAMRGIKRSGLFVVGLGDGLNDAQIFQEADISFGFDPVVGKLVDKVLPQTPNAAESVLRLAADDK